MNQLSSLSHQNTSCRLCFVTFTSHKCYPNKRSSDLFKPTKVCMFCKNLPPHIMPGQFKTWFHPIINSHSNDTGITDDKEVKKHQDTRASDGITFIPSFTENHLLSINISVCVWNKRQADGHSEGNVTNRVTKKKISLFETPVSNCWTPYMPRTSWCLVLGTSRVNLYSVRDQRRYSAPPTLKQLTFPAFQQQNLYVVLKTHQQKIISLNKITGEINTKIITQQSQNYFLCV